MKCQVSVTQEMNLPVYFFATQAYCQEIPLLPSISTEPKTLNLYPDPTELLVENNYPLSPGLHYFMVSLL